MTFFPRSSLYLIHIRSNSPHSELPTVPTASASGNSPRFCGWAKASRIRFSRSFFIGFENSWIQRMNHVETISSSRTNNGICFYGSIRLDERLPLRQVHDLERFL